VGSVEAELNFYRENSHEWTKFDDCDDLFESAVQKFLAQATEELKTLMRRHEEVMIEVRL
jgi:hypothetical protein